MLLLLLLPLILVFFLIHTSERIRYQKTEYFIQTRIPFRHIVWDKGALGEYYIYSSLTPLPGSKRFLFNCYIPKPNGETTEIDVIMIHSSGIYVFESKITEVGYSEKIPTDIGHKLSRRGTIDP